MRTVALRSYRSSRPSGEVDDDPPSSCSTTNTIGIKRAAVEHEQVVRGVRLDRDDPPEHRAVAVAHLRADQLVHPDLVAGASSSGRRSATAPRSASAALRSSTPSKRTSKRSWCGRDDDDLEHAVAVAQSVDARREPLGAGW